MLESNIIQDTMDLYMLNFVILHRFATKKKKKKDRVEGASDNIPIVLTRDIGRAPVGFDRKGLTNTSHKL